MNSLKSKKIAIIGQYIFWSLVVSSARHLFGVRYSIFMIGLFIVLTLLGMNMTKLLTTLETQKDRVIFLVQVVLAVMVASVVS